MLDDVYLGADSSDGSAEWFSAAQAPSCGTDPSTLQQAAQPLSTTSKRRGRPRRYDTTLPLGEPAMHPVFGSSMSHFLSLLHSGRMLCGHML